MREVVDVVQCPPGLSQSSLPDTLEVGVPFTVDGREYVLAEGGTGGLMACEREDDWVTTAPSKCGRYYVIKRI